MKEFIEKLIGRLKEEKSDWNYDYNVPLNNAIEIVNQLAEEYNNESVNGDLISRSALIEAINEQVKGWGKKGIMPSLFSAVAIVQNQPTVCNDGWIPVSEKLPGEEYIICIEGADFYKHVLTTTQDENAQFCVGWYDQEDETWYDLEGFAYHPIAWQPLPPKFEPKGE